jgi:DnaD/phage-associated family protein
MGFDEESLKRVAEYCFLRNVKTLDGMNEKVSAFYNQGAITVESINEVIASGEQLDNTIRQILTTAGTSRTVTARDRESYKTWTERWKMSKELILYAASLSNGAINPVAYINSLLASWFNQKIDSVEKAKQTSPSPAVTPKTANKVEKTYTSEQLNAMFNDVSYDDM